MTGPSDVALSIAIPVYATPAELLARCLASVARAKTGLDDVFVVLDGPQPPKTAAAAAIATELGFTVIENKEHAGMTATWNACLALGQAAFVHVMHADDEIGEGYYDAVRQSATAGIDLIAAGKSPAAASRADAPRPQTPQRLSDGSAAAYLLSSDKPPAGSFVIRRDALRATSPWFDPRYPYCPDEELHLRLVSRGDLALVDRHLYRESRHDAQARFETWRQPDFAEIYFGARLGGAALHDARLQRRAIRETSRRLYSVGRVLAEQGDLEGVARLVATIRNVDRRSWRDARLWALATFARVPATIRLLRGAAALRMRVGRGSDGR